MADLPKPAGQPFTFSGVARYATARFPRLIGVSAIFAFIAAAVIARLASQCWWPVLTEAVSALPEVGAIQDGLLQLQETQPRLLAANRFLSIQFNLDWELTETPPVDLAWEFGRDELRITSLFGQTAVPYLPTTTFPLDRATVLPLWGAWKEPLAAAFGAVGAVLLILTWFALACFYTPLARLAAWVARRDLNSARSWKLCVAAQWPGALLMTFTLALYSTGEISLLFVLAMFGAHFIPTFLYVTISPFFVPEPAVAASRTKQNPFETDRRKPKAAKRNPFKGGRDDD